MSYRCHVNATEPAGCSQRHYPSTFEHGKLSQVFLDAWYIRGTLQDGIPAHLPHLSPAFPPPPQPCWPQMPTFQSHLSVLESSVKLYPTLPAFRLPVVDQETSRISEWTTVTYAQFHKDVEIYARYWTSLLSAAGVTPGSVIGLWYVQISFRLTILGH